MKFQFRHEYWGDEWQEVPGEHYDHEAAAEHVAEEHWSDDPSDPSHFEMKIEVRSLAEPNRIVMVKVTAEASVNFYGREVAWSHNNVAKE